MSGPCTDCGGPDYQTLEARIAELEAENKRLQESDDRYCDDCDRESYCAVLYAAYEEFTDLGDGGGDFACNRWQPRRGGEG